LHRRDRELMDSRLLQKNEGEGQKKEAYVSADERNGGGKKKFKMK